MSSITRRGHTERQKASALSQRLSCTTIASVISPTQPLDDDDGAYPSAEPIDGPVQVDGGLPEAFLRTLPFPLVAASIAIAFFGRKIRRFYALTLGIVVGMAIIHATVPSVTAGLGSKGALFSLCALGLAITGLLAILIRHVASGAALGATIGTTLN